ncbi:MAG: cobalt-precorrin-5B (C(1))-methyltransferase [Dehalococcoidia bacterium]|nr:cobalt-precorrin-5B (C(1))-methyltransferase [Dehalococcoidia bacterium]
MAKQKSELKTGYTTGSCAAAAAKAATIALMSQTPVDEVEITLPGGGVARLIVEKCTFSGDQAHCCVIKDAGDDPDVTHGAEICATVRRTGRPGIAISRGEGVGTVTKPGLGLEVGSPAINPVPRKMIEYSVAEAMAGDKEQGVEVVISAPKGAELAKRTLNERLGIIGGISILGTTGIVKPFSTAAYRACITQGLKVAKANGCETVVLTTGGRTEKYAQRIMDLPDEAFIQMGDFVGFTLRQCVAKGIRNVVVVAMMGKLSKIAAGNLQTHVSHSRVDAGFLAGLALECGISPTLVEEMRGSNTARHFSEMLPEKEADRVFERLCELACFQSRSHAGVQLRVECILVGFDGQVLGRARVDG